MTEPHSRAADLVLRIELELRRLDLWEAQAPPPDALHSDAPFCCDTLALEQWLQWVFLPRMHALIRTGATLPPRSGILPYAEESPLGRDPRAGELLALIRRFDRLIEEHVGHPR